MSGLIAKTGVNRRMALAALVAMSAAGPLARGRSARLRAKPGVGPAGTAADPDLVNPVVPWQRSLSDDALAKLRVLVDLILPADERSPAASALGAHDFVDEWVSAPYERQQQDRLLLLEGLDWLDEESRGRFDSAFVELSELQQTMICDDICDLTRVTEAHRDGARCFALVRNLTAGAVWTTEEGLADLGYVGNTPLPKWELPPRSVLRHLGLE